MSDIRPYEFIEKYGLFLGISFVLFTYLGAEEFGYPLALLQTALLLTWAWAGHVVCHIEGTPIYPINPHVQLHHKHTIEMPRWLNLGSELLVNFFGFTILILFQWLLGFHVLSNYIVLAAAFLYILIHIFDYSLLPNKEHTAHHINENCNYGPHFMDVLFGTRCVPEDPYDDFNNKIPHVSLSFAAAYYLRENPMTREWIDGLLRHTVATDSKGSEVRADR